MRWKPHEEFTSLKALDSALAKQIDGVRETVITHDPRDKALLKEFGTAPWAPVEVPSWFLNEKARQEVRQNNKVLFCAGGGAEGKFSK